MKAILVIDKPEYCEQCPVKYVTQCYGVYRKRNIKCPLKPLPQKIDERRIYGGNLLDIGHMYGRNDCIDEILGEEYEI